RALSVVYPYTPFPYTTLFRSGFDREQLAGTHLVPVDGAELGDLGRDQLEREPGESVRGRTRPHHRAALAFYFAQVDQRRGAFDVSISSLGKQVCHLGQRSLPVQTI